jgi:hypothetical protein
MLVGMILGVVGLGSGSVHWVGRDPLEDPSLLDWLLLRLPPASVIGKEHVTRIIEERVQGIPVKLAPRLAEHLLDLCRRYRFDPSLLLALIQVESGFRAHAVSPKGAIGLMQVQPETAMAVVERHLRGASPLSKEPFLGPRVEQALLNPFHNLSIAVAYLAYLRDRYIHRSAYVLLAAYNLGPTRMDELLSRKNFKPDKTKRYFDAIRREQRCFFLGAPAGVRRTQDALDCHV